MTSRYIFLQGKHPRNLTLLLVLKSSRFRYWLVRLLPLATKLIALVSLISLAITFHAQLTSSQTTDLPSNDPTNLLASMEEIVQLRSAYANHYHLDNNRYNPERGP